VSGASGRIVFAVERGWLVVWGGGEVVVLGFLRLRSVWG